MQFFIEVIKFKHEFTLTGFLLRMTKLSARIIINRMNL